MEKVIASILTNAEWLMLGFLGTVIAVFKMDTEKVGWKEIFLTMLSGMICCYLVPKTLIWYFETDAEIVGFLGAFGGGLLGMRLVALALNIDVQSIVNKRLGGK